MANIILKNKDEIPVTHNGITQIEMDRTGKVHKYTHRKSANQIAKNLKKNKAVDRILYRSFLTSKSLRVRNTYPITKIY